MMHVTNHFSVEEFACHDGTSYPVSSTDNDIGGTWLLARLMPLCMTLEAIREACGNLPLEITSGYRTLAYDEKIYEASAKDGSVAPASRSQHPMGRAADVKHATLKPYEFFNAVLALYQDGKLPSLGGIGLYPTFVHIDVRPRGTKDHLAIWGGSRPDGVA